MAMRSRMYSKGGNTMSASKKIVSFSVLAIITLMFSITVFANVPLEKMLLFPFLQSEYKVSVTVSKGEGGVYQPLEKVELMITPNVDSYIVVWDAAPDGNVHIIFPNQYDRNNFIQAGQTLRLPRQGYSFQVEPGAYGVEWVQVIASTAQFVQFADWSQQFQTEAFPSLPLDAVMSLKTDITSKMMVIPQTSQTLAEFTSAFTHFYVGKVPLVGWATFVTSPAGASVMVDGQWLLQTTPVERLTLKEGIHYVRFMKEGFLPVEMTFTVNPDEHRYHSSVLVPSVLPSTLILNPVPQEAIVRVNGMVVATGKAILEDLRAGSYLVEVALEGYKTQKETLLLASGEVKQKDFILQRQTGNVSIAPFPADAKVTIAGKVYQPVNGNVEVELVIGEYAIRTEAQGYKTDDRTLTVVTGINPLLRIPLIPMKAVLTLLSDPSEAKVKINGFENGKTPLKLELDAGTYRLVVEKEYFQSQAQNITLIPGEERTIAVVMLSTVGYLHVPAPDGISLYINDTFRGWAPDTLLLEEGVYTLSLKDKGKERYRQQIRIVAGQTLTISLP